MSVFLSRILRSSAAWSCVRMPAQRTNMICQIQTRRNMAIGKKINQADAFTWRSFAIVSIAGLGAMYYLRVLKEEKDKEREIERKRQLGKAAIGGPFELIDQDRKVRTSEEFKGQWLLIYFGFTHCPDICPDEIEKMVATVEKINANELVPNIQPLFITVDPARDTPEVVGKYIKEFSEKFIGLTGSDEQVDKVCKAYRVYYSAGPKDIDKDYIVDHTIIIYLVNPDGEFVDYFGQTKNSDEVANGIVLQMVKYEKMKGSSMSILDSFRRGRADLTA